MPKDRVRSNPVGLNVYSRGYVLALCDVCRVRYTYVEPHGTTAPCNCSDEWTEHTGIPAFCRDMRDYVIRRHPDDKKMVAE